MFYKSGLHKEQKGEFDHLFYGLEYQDPDQSPAYIEIKFTRVDGYNTLFHDDRNFRRFLWSTSRKLMDRHIVVLRYVAKLYRDYPDYRISIGGITKPAPVVKRDELLRARKRFRMKVTKAKNKLDRWEAYQRTLLINQLESAEHNLVRKKIAEFEEELKQIELKIELRK